MNSSEADRQIRQMIAFITQEAKEKAEEIRQKTAEQKTLEKLTFRSNAKKLIKQEFEQKRKDKLTEKRIHRSTKINEARFTVMRKRNTLMTDLYNDILERLCDVAGTKEYPVFLRYSIVEGLTTIMEKNVTVRCRKEDLDIVKKQIKAAREEYMKLVKRETGIKDDVSISVDEQNFLPPHPSGENKGVTCRGGVVLTALRGRISLDNTLEARLRQSFRDNQPIMRGMLFGKRPPPANAYGH